MIEAEIRLWGADQHGQPKLTGLADLIRDDARFENRRFTLDEFLVVNFGLLPSEVAKIWTKSDDGQPSLVRNPLAIHIDTDPTA